MIFSRGASGCLALKVRHGWHFQICSFIWAAMQGQKNWSCMRSSMHSRPRWQTSLWHPFRVTSLCTAGKTSWKRISFDSLGLAFQYRTSFCKRRWFCSSKNWLHSGVCLFRLLLPQGSIPESGTDQTQGWISLLGLTPVFQGHTGDLVTVLHWDQDV